MWLTTAWPPLPQIRGVGLVGGEECSWYLVAGAATKGSRRYCASAFYSSWSFPFSHLDAHGSWDSQKNKNIMKWQVPTLLNILYARFWLVSFLRFHYFSGDNWIQSWRYNKGRGWWRSFCNNSNSKWNREDGDSWKLSWWYNKVDRGAYTWTINLICYAFKCSFLDEKNTFNKSFHVSNNHICKCHG